MNILFYGNCQVHAIHKILSKNPIKCHVLSCYTTEITRNEFDDILKECDVIVTQYIRNGYRDRIHLSTDYILDKCKKGCKVIILNSCHFSFYHFDLTYKTIDGSILHKPIDYHYGGMIQCFKDGLSAECYMEKYINNINLKSSEELNKLVVDNISELKRRSDEIVDKYAGKAYHIPIAEYIESNYKNTLLFYSINHPTKYVFWYMCAKIVEIVDINMNIDYNCDPLEAVQCMLYKCIQKIVNFDVDKHLPLVNGKSDLLEVTNLYYDIYRTFSPDKL